MDDEEDQQLIRFKPLDVRTKAPQVPGPEILTGIEESIYTEIAKNKAIILMLVCLAIVVAVLLKRIKFLERFVQYVPESGIIMFLGVFVTWIVDAAGFDQQLTIYGWVIEHLMIAPIILHASYCLFHPHFFGQLGTILLLAIVATVLNCLIITGIVYASLMLTGDDFLSMMPVHQVLMYSALISAVDPVAVLAVFDTVGANRALYYLVFGESLLNDGVTFVMYKGFKVFTILTKEAAAEVEMKYYLFGILVGLFNGLLSSYIVAIMLGFTWILSLIAFGLTQQRYTFRNIDNTSVVKTRTVVREFAMVAELFLFFILGSEFSVIHFGNIITFATIVWVVMTIARAIVTSFLSFVMNKFTRHEINWKWQILLIVGGMRGAIAYAMVIQYQGRPYYDVFYETTVFLIFVTTVLNGMLAKPLVGLLQLKEEVGDQDCDHEYGWDDLEKLSPVVRAFKSFEDRIILPLFTKDHKTMKLAIMN